MRRFILRENIKLLGRQLLSAPDKAALQAMIDEAWIELAALERLWKASCPNRGIRNALGENREDILDRAVR